MATERVKFTFPPDLVNQPVIYNMGKQFGVVNNIRTANLSPDRGWVILEMVGNEIADPVGTEFRALHKEQSLGLPIREAMMNLVERMPLDDMRFLATAILLQKESGGNLAQILDKTSAVVRERARLRGQLKIYTAQGRITGWILCAAPFLMFALISVVNHNYEKTLFSNALGMKMIYGGLGLMVLGILAIRKIIDVKV